MTRVPTGGAVMGGASAPPRDEATGVTRDRTTGIGQGSSGVPPLELREGKIYSLGGQSPDTQPPRGHEQRCSAEAHPDPFCRGDPRWTLGRGGDGIGDQTSWRDAMTFDRTRKELASRSCTGVGAMHAPLVRQVSVQDRVLHKNLRTHVSFVRYGRESRRVGGYAAQDARPSKGRLRRQRPTLPLVASSPRNSQIARTTGPLWNAAERSVGTLSVSSAGRGIGAASAGKSTGHFLSGWNELRP
jgi:hypothetical protein